MCWKRRCHRDQTRWSSVEMKADYSNDDKTFVFSLKVTNTWPEALIAHCTRITWDTLRQISKGSLLQPHVFLEPNFRPSVLKNVQNQSLRLFADGDQGVAIIF